MKTFTENRWWGTMMSHHIKKKKNEWMKNTCMSTEADQAQLPNSDHKTTTEAAADLKIITNAEEWE